MYTNKFANNHVTHLQHVACSNLAPKTKREGIGKVMLEESTVSMK
jgi:hypothetical protein